ncbi:chitinase N-terminal domain-containing protein [Paenibacillus sp. FSL W8-1187]|uniref:Chitinase A N-terminal domain-containing protein n=2 Tax=Paenibacillus TaxID=44249 RepID=A0A2N5N1T3_9BACL|nr:chitinase N-terminal domain-containing protein [Paenibacillus pasadenensis]PLT44276.1 hypothetical protein B8V81_2707 [Paenibacillus pasadenensis]
MKDKHPSRSWGKRWMSALLAAAVALPAAPLAWGGSVAHAEGPADPAPFIKAKVVNHNAGKKILFDNAHGNTAGAADWVIDGGFSDFGNALAQNGYDVQELRKSGPIALADLQPYDVFVTAEAQVPLKASEQAALAAYVDGGGSVFFIGDHYNADRNKNRWDGSEVYNGYRRGAWSNPAKGMSAEEAASAAMQGVVSSDWLAEQFGIRFRYNALGDLNANVIVPPAQSFGITQGVGAVAMHAGSTLAIVDPAKAKGIVYVPKTTQKWGSAVDQGVYNGGGVEEGPYVAVSKKGAGKAAFIGDSSPVEDATPKYLREETGARKTTYDGFKEQDDGRLLVNLIDWLSVDESYTSFAQVDGLQLDSPTPLLAMENPAASTEPQAEPWAAPSAGYKWYDPATFKAGSYGYVGGSTPSPSASPTASPSGTPTPTSSPTPAPGTVGYGFEAQAVLPNSGAEFPLRVTASGLTPGQTVSGYSFGVYTTANGTQIAQVQNADGSWPSAYAYSAAFSLQADSAGYASKELTVRLKPGSSGAANMRLRLNGTNLKTSPATLGDVPAEPLPTPTPTATPPASPSATPTATPTPSATPEPTATPTPSPSATPSVSPSPTPALSIAAARALPAGTTVTLTGTALHEPGIYGGGESFYLQDESGGIYVYQSAPGVKAGDRVTLTGRLAVYNTELELTDLSALSVVGGGAPPAAADAVGVSDANQGMLVSIGEAVISNLADAAPSGSFEFDATTDAGTKTRIRVDVRTGLSRSEFGYGNGDRVVLQGIASIFKGTYQLKPRGLEDIAAPADRIAPSTALTLSGEPNAAGWHREPAAFTLAATDDRAGELATFYTLNGGEPIRYAGPASVESEGETTIRYYSVDAAGNREAAKTAVVRLDRTVPTVQLTQSGAPVTDAGFTDELRFELAASDAISGIAASELLLDGLPIESGSSRLAADLGLGSHTIRYVVTDLAGNVAEQTTAFQVRAQAGGASGAPGVPVLSDDSGHKNGLRDGQYAVTMNLWWGENGSIFRLYENGMLVRTEVLADRTPAAQSVRTEFSGKKNGVYVYTAELINPHGVTKSAQLRVAVTDANPGKPSVSHNNWDGDGSYRISANLWWGTNATEYRLYENGTLIDVQALSASTPSAQAAFTDLAGRAPGVYSYRVELVNAAGVTSSDTIQVVVSR